jgi:uncharacterized protein
VIPTLPLPLRDRLAHTIVTALHDPGARRELAALAEAGGRGWLANDEARWAAPLATRARAAASALADRPLLAHHTDLAAALQAAATLFEAGLYFEVHEVLEPHWLTADGEARQALQGLIQIAVGWQHVANDNLAGARSLLVEGSVRLRGMRVLALDLDAFARAAAGAADAVAAGRAAVPARFPRAESVHKEGA